jgi:hypothetical protein
LANPDALAAKGRLGKARASALFSWEVVADAHERIFSDIAEFRAREARLPSPETSHNPERTESASVRRKVLRRERETAP